MTSFVNSAFLTKEPCYKFMLKYDTQNYFGQFTKTLSLCFLLNTTHAEMVMCTLLCLIVEVS